MHLSEILDLRSQPAAGISIGITRKCPLSCAHCSTNSSLASEEHPEHIFRDFVDSFTLHHHPQIMALSGGEALLRPKLIMQLAERAHQVGTKVVLLSGLYFAKHDRIPANIEKAIRSVDHFSVSTDAFHEVEVPRHLVFKTLDQVLSFGVDASIHLVGLDEDDPYLADAILDIQQHFGDQIPVLVNTVKSFGRARDWIDDAKPAQQHRVEASPCQMASWPVMAYDGTIVACGNDDVIEILPEHLILGHATQDSWQEISERSQSSCILRAIRLYGPEYIADRFAPAGSHASSYCGTCMKLHPDRDFAPQLEAQMAKASTKILEQAVAVLRAEGGAESFVRLQGAKKYAGLVSKEASS